MPFRTPASISAAIEARNWYAGYVRRKAKEPTEGDIETFVLKKFAHLRPEEMRYVKENCKPIREFAT